MICQNLSISDVCKLMNTNKYIYNTLKNMDFFWVEISMREYGYPLSYIGVIQIHEFKNMRISK